MEEKRSFGRREMAAWLEDLARQFQSGTFQAGEKSYRVPETLKAKLELKAKGEMLALKLSVLWPKRPEMAAARPSGPGPGQPLQAAPQPARSFKELKKRLAAVFEELQRAAARGTLPPGARVEEFLALSRESARFAEPEWESEMQEFLDHAENLQRAHSQGHLELFAHELRDLRTRMRTCHEEYA